MSEPVCKLTEYGFIYGPLELTRVSYYRGTAFMQVKTKRGSWIVSVTKGGLMRSWKETKKQKGK